VHTTQHRKPTMGDKISGGLMNLKGSLTGKPGVKVSFFLDCTCNEYLLTILSGCWHSPRTWH
jgi:hypothetical protein